MIRLARKPVHVTRLRGRIKILCYFNKGLRHSTEEVSSRVDFVLQRQPGLARRKRLEPNLGAVLLPFGVMVPGIFDQVT